MGRKPKSIKALSKICEEWNRQNPIGTTVKYHPIIGRAEHRIRTTRAEAMILSGHTAVVWLNDESGCVALEACEPGLVLGAEPRKEK